MLADTTELAMDVNKMAMTEEGQILQFVPFASAIEVGFWHKLTRKKLEEFKLDDSARNIIGSYSNNGFNGLPSHLSVDYDSFEHSASVMAPRNFLVEGSLLNKNTMDDFKTCDKKEIIKEVSNQIWQSIQSGEAIKNPSLIGRFLLLTFADLKKYHYYYWFAFPALIIEQNATAKKPVKVSDKFSTEQIQMLQNSYDDLAKRIGHDPGYFLVQRIDDSISLAELADFDVFFKDTDEVTVGFSDPSNLDEYPGWPLRNFLALISFHWGAKIKKLEVLCYRDRVRDGKRDVGHSLLLDIEALPDFRSCTDLPRVVGWEKNEKQKMIPRMVNLSATMDPVKLAESAVDLNLKLMRWRLVPEIDLELISTTRCLLLGSGTLGCNVARNLMGWGVRKITFVDNSRISYSNPVRQTLFEFEDCKNGGKKKAKAAAESLKRIFPGIDTRGIELTIPMPGHSVGSSEDEINRIRKDVEALETLFDEHDVIFLLMDTRESRWLPTLLGAAKRKIIINAALGFDTFMVMRHGLKRESSDTESSALEVSQKKLEIPGDRLGCYFCSDVVAPGDSTRDRTLDQQCTVSRPGISMMASALAVELLVSVLQHKEGGYAAADTSGSEDYFDNDFATPLGMVPHQIRAFMSRFQLLTPVSLAFNCCTACSDIVVKAYNENGFEFLLKVFNVPKYLEDCTGLTKLQESTLETEIIEWSDDDFDENAD
ncbi:ubiquitin-like modifier-activating enzyme ATG7 isoform X2 [Rhopilema esculentum]|uniref:ubiquitin-like modifier-activating enzyme ATG7 isoform X2 n=1 Tax=Rhopilema esculentum TaxID=499914 RepID=UPI0031DEE462